MSKKAKTPEGELLVCRNPSATHRFAIEERVEAGMVLTGSEVKSLRAKKGDLEGAYASVDRDEVYLHKMHIAPYEQAGVFGHEPKRTRKLLLHRKQIERLRGSLSAKGYTLIPTRVYFKTGRAKIELGLAKAKNVGDRRDDIRKKQDLREAKAAMGKTRGR